MHNLIYFVPRSCIPPTYPFITSSLPAVLQGIHVFPFLFRHHMSSWQAFLLLGPPSCQLTESPSKAVVAAGIPPWPWATLGFTQRTEKQTLLAFVWLRSPSDNPATNFNVASSLTSPWTTLLSSLWRELAAMKYILWVCKEGPLH